MAAAAAGVRRLVYLSFVAAAADATFTLARDHWHTEEHVRAGGLPWTFLRMNLFMDFVPSMVLSDGVIRGPAGDGRLAAILRDDVAAAAAAVLTSDGHAGRTYDLTGPAELALTDVAAVLTAVTGRAVPYVPATVEEAFASRASYGAPDRLGEAWVWIYTAIAAGEMAGVSPAAPTWPGTRRARWSRCCAHGLDARGLRSRGRQVRWRG